MVGLGCADFARSAALSAATARDDDVEGREGGAEADGRAMGAGGGLEGGAGFKLLPERFCEEIADVGCEAITIANCKHKTQ